MLVKQKFMKKKEVSFVKETDTISEVLGQLNSNQKVNIMNQRLLKDSKQLKSFTN